MLLEEACCSRDPIVLCCHLLLPTQGIDLRRAMSEINAKVACPSAALAERSERSLPLVVAADFRRGGKQRSQRRPRGGAAAKSAVAPSIADALRARANNRD